MLPTYSVLLEAIGSLILWSWFFPGFAVLWYFAFGCRLRPGNVDTRDRLSECAMTCCRHFNDKSRLDPVYPKPCSSNNVVYDFSGDVQREIAMSNDDSKNIYFR